MKNIMVTTVLLISMFNAVAQDKRRGDMEIGGNIGLNLSNVVVDDSDSTETDSRTSFNIGASGEYYFSDRWGIKGKLIYDNKGAADGFIDIEDENSFFIEQKTGDAVFTYISIPVMANWHFGKKRNWYINLGLYYATLINAEVADIDVKEFYNSSDFGLTFGGGFRYPINTTTNLFVEYDGQTGLSNIAKGNSVTVSNGRSSFNVGVLFDL